MTQYDDLFLRGNLSDNGEIPKPGTQFQSPDVIPYGPGPVVDPRTTFANNYNQYVAKPLQINAQNYLYLRAKNFKDGPQEGTASIYYAPANIILFPSVWRENILSTSDGRTGTPVRAAMYGDIAITTDPLTWIPQVPPPETHYSLIGLVATPEHPNPIPNINSIDDLAIWLAKNGGIGMMNVQSVTAGSPTFTSTVPYQQGDRAYRVAIMIECVNVPMGSWVGFSAGTPTGDMPIFLPKTEVTSEPNFQAGITTNVPENYATHIAYSWWSNGKEIPPGATITLRAYVVSEGNDVIAELSRSTTHLGLNNAALYTYEKGFVRAGSLADSPRLIPVGSHTTRIEPSSDKE